MVRHNGEYGWFEGVRVVLDNGQHGRLEGSEEGSELLLAPTVEVKLRGSGIATNPAGWSGVMMLRHNGQYGRLE